MEERSAYIIPPPCIIFTTVKFFFYMFFLVIFLGYIGKAIYMMAINNETLGQTLMHISFYFPDSTFFFWAIGFLLLLYGIIVATTILTRCLCKCHEYEDSMERGRGSKKKARNYTELRNLDV